MLYKILCVIVCSVIAIRCAWADPIYVHDAQGRPVQITELKNKWIMITYWATWCDTCVDDIPGLNRFFAKNRDKNVLFFGVDYDQPPPEGLNKAIDTMHIHFPVILEDPNEVWQLGTVEILPTTFIVNPQGQVVKKLVGPSTPESLLSTLHALQHKK